MKKQLLIFTLILSICLSICCPLGNVYAETYIGYCGDNVKWELDTDTGFLRIYGTGEMTSAPWQEYKDYIYSVEIEYGVTGIFSSAFAYSGNLTSVSIPSSVTHMSDNRPFRGCSSLSTLTVSEYNENFSSEDNVLFNKDKTTLICCAGGKSGEYTILDGVENISEGAFEGCYNLTDIFIPEGVTEIGNYAFSGCSKLKTIEIPEGVTDIKGFTFDVCLRLTEVTLPDSVTTIDYYAFQSCIDLTSIKIPKNLSTISPDAFNGCDSLASITVDENNEYYSSEDNVLFNKDKTSLILCPKAKEGEYVIPNSITSIGISAFSGCNNLTHIAIPNGISRIEYDTFSFCSSLSGISLPESITYIGDWSFQGSGLVDIEIPKNMTYIGDGAFWGCGSLTDVTIPDGMSTINRESFYYCYSLTDVFIPDSITTIEHSAFAECSALTNVYFNGGMDKWNKINIAEYNTALTDNVKCYSNFIFEENGGSEVTDISAYSVAEQPVSTLQGHTLMGWYDNESLSGNAVTFPYGEFYNTDITLYAKWGRDIYTVTYRVNGRTTDTFYVEYEGKVILPQEEAGYIYIYTVDGQPWTPDTPITKNTTIEVTKNPGGYCGDSVQWELDTDTGLLHIYGTGEMTDTPWREYIDYIKTVEIEYGVTSIHDGAFSNCYYLTDISIPDTVTYIGSIAFYNCSALTQVKLPKNITAIYYATFYGCSSLGSTSIPNGVTYIGDDAFYGCSSLSSIGIPESVDKIGVNAFNGCIGLVKIDISPKNPYFSSDYNVIFNKDKTQLIYCRENITGSYTIPDTVTSIEDYAFSDCYYLSAVEIPEGVTYIGTHAFDNSGLTHIEIPNGVTNIEKDTFSNCRSLSNVTIPDSVTTIGNGAFRFCSSLTSVTIPSSVTNIEHNAFYSSPLDNVRYPGNLASWNNITIGSYNEALTDNVKCYSNFIFEENGGSEVSDISAYSVTEQPTTIYDGCIFMGWYDNPEFNGEAIQFPYGEFYNTDITLYAKWECSITYTGELEGTTDTAETFGSVTLPECTEDNYHYAFTVNGKEWDGTNITSSVTVNVTKVPNNYTVTYTLDGEVIKQVSVAYLGTAETPEAPYGYIFTYTMNGQPWTADMPITGDTLIKVAKTPITYRVAFILDNQPIKEISVQYLSLAELPVAPYGYDYTYTLDGQPWDSSMPIEKDTTIEVTKTPKTYTVTYLVDSKMIDTYSVEYQNKAILPGETYGYDYSYTVGGQPWNRELPIIKDTIIEATTTPKSFVVIYKLDNQPIKEISVQYLSLAELPVVPYGYDYTYTLDGQPWDSSMPIEKDTTIEVTKTPKTYTVTYVLDGEVIKTEDVPYLNQSAPPQAPEGYVYQFYSNGNQWDFVVRDNTTVNVYKKGDSTAFELNLENLSINGSAVYGNYYGQHYIPVCKVQEGANAEFYKDASCTIPAEASITLAKGINTLYLKITAESGREQVYTVTIDRNIPDSLGMLRVPQITGSDFVVSIENFLPGNPRIDVNAGTVSYRDISLLNEYSPLEKNLLVHGDGILSPNSVYWVDVVITYDEIVLKSEPIKITTGYIKSSGCDIIRCLSHPGTVDQENKQITNVIVRNNEVMLEIDLQVSPKATWKLYEDPTCKKEVAGNIFDLTHYAGKTKTMYVKVVAENEVAYKIYSMAIYRQSKTIQQPYITLNDGLITITTSGECIVKYTTDGSIPIDSSPTTKTYTGPFDASGAEFICAIAKEADKDEYCDPVTVTNTAYDVVYVNPNGKLIKTEKVLENGKSIPPVADEGYRYEFTTITGQSWDIDTPITEAVTIVATPKELSKTAQLTLNRAEETSPGEYSLNFDVTSDGYVSGQLLFAFYDSRNILVDFETSNLSASAENYNAEYILAAKPGAAYCKILLLNDTDSLIPMAKNIRADFN